MEAEEGEVSVFAEPRRQLIDRHTKFLPAAAAQPLREQPLRRGLSDTGDSRSVSRLEGPAKSGPNRLGAALNLAPVGKGRSGVQMVDQPEDAPILVGLALLKVLAAVGEVKVESFDPAPHVTPVEPLLGLLPVVSEGLSQAGRISIGLPLKDEGWCLG